MRDDIRRPSHGHQRGELKRLSDWKNERSEAGHPVHIRSVYVSVPVVATSRAAATIPASAAR
jgi:hypothetical protein